MDTTKDISDFQTLMVAYYEAAGITAAPPENNMHRINIEEVPVIVSFQKHVDGPSVFMVAHFDAMPKENAVDLLENMVLNNFLLQVVGTPVVWCVNPMTGQIVATSRVLMQELTAPMLGARLEVFVQEAKTMLREMRLPDPDAKSKVNRMEGTAMRNRLLLQAEKEQDRRYCYVRQTFCNSGLNDLPDFRTPNAT